MKPAVKLGLLLLMAALAPAQAQLYKWVGPDGKVNYTDTPPPSDAKLLGTKSTDSETDDNAVALPYELAQAAKNHPVTLYTGNNCAPCNAGRSLLTARGVPFTEKTITTNEDVVHLREISGETELPVLLVGRSKQKGYEAGAWNAALAAAGYPKSSILPKTYRNPEPQPAVKVRKEEEPDQPVADAHPPSVPTPPPAAGNAPPGFRF